MPDKRIEEIEQRCNAATEGPWISRFETNETQEKDISSLYSAEKTIIEAGWYDGPLLLIGLADDVFISHAREDIPYLLSEYHRLSAEVERLQAELDKRPQPKPPEEDENE